MLFRQLMDEASHTFTYLLADPVTKKAALIDPVDRMIDRDLLLIEELGLTLHYVLETHVHADHVTAAGELRRRTGATTVAGVAAGVGCADLLLNDGEHVRLGDYRLEVRATPGHTQGCVSYIVHTAARTLAFTGDALLIRGCGRTDFQGGDAAMLYRSVREKLFSMPAETVIYPGHDYRGRTSSTVGEERAHNPRLREGISVDEFVTIMSELKLASPAMMDIAVPANMACGARSATVDVQALQASPEKLASYRIIDVRELFEFDGPLGHLPGAELVPLATLGEAADSWRRSQAILLICKSGRRAETARVNLVARGFSDVTVLAGGMTAWRSAEPDVAACG